MTASTYITVNPSLIMPGVLMQYGQKTGAFNILQSRAPEIKLGSEDKMVYVRQLSMRSDAQVSQVNGTVLPGVGFTTSMVGTPTYLVKARSVFDRHSTADAANWGYNLPNAQQLGLRQAIYQQMRNALLYGVGAGEGLLNTANATNTNLPADSLGHTTILTYDNGEMSTFILKTISQILTNTFMLGQPFRVAILLPQRVLAKWAYYGVIQLSSFQREGAGSNSIAGTVKSIAGWSSGEIEFCIDETLIGKGAGGTDAIIFTVPELNTPDTGGLIDTNTFASLQPSILATSLMLADKSAPTEIYSPLPDGATDLVQELRITSGFCVRPEALTILSAAYQ